MTRRTFVAFVLLVALVVNTACATSYGPPRPVLEPARQAEVVRKQAEALGPGTPPARPFSSVTLRGSRSNAWRPGRSLSCGLESRLGL
jgi:hypothetical protein